MSKSQPSQSGQRLQKVLAAAGLGSRRECEELIVEGRVDVDREIVNELGARVDPDEQKIRVDGEPIKIRRKLYFAVNKPSGVVCTNRDPDGRPRVVDLVNTDERLFTIGRLDRTSEGLIIVTNDGALANRLAHPRHGIEKTYHVHVAGHPSEADLDQLRKGVHLADGYAHCASVLFVKKRRESSELEIVLNEGRNREIRRLLARIGHKVLRLERIAIGPLKLGPLPTGHYRPISQEELGHLNSLASGREKTNKRPSRPARVKGAGAKGPRSPKSGSSREGSTSRGVGPRVGGKPGSARGGRPQSGKSKSGKPGGGRPSGGRPGGGGTGSSKGSSSFKGKGQRPSGGKPKR